MRGFKIRKGWQKPWGPRLRTLLKFETVASVHIAAMCSFFSIPHAAAHAEALILSASGHAPSHQFHETHQLTREWTDADLDKVVDNRAGVKDAARDQRKR